MSIISTTNWVSLVAVLDIWNNIMGIKVHINLTIVLKYLYTHNGQGVHNIKQ